MQKKQALAPIEIALREHEYLKALRLADAQLVGANPHAWDLKRMKAELAMHSGEHGMAKAIYEEALSQRNLPWARLGLSKIQFNEGRFNDARRELKEITDGNRAYLDAYPGQTGRPGRRPGSPATRPRHLAARAAQAIASGRSRHQTR